MYSAAIDNPNQSIKLSESQAVSLLDPILFLPREATPGETYFTPLKFIKVTFLEKNTCLPMTEGKRSGHGSCILNFHVPDSN